MNKNSIIGRMFANASSDNSNNDITLTNKSRPASPLISNTKRNLFGIRLNHDQLKQDLKDMWKDQINQQNQNWGFDFEKLTPLENSNTNDNIKIAASPMCKQNIKRFEWTKVNTKLNPFFNESDMKSPDSHLMASFNKEELISNESDYETEEEEYDDALAIPTFYKYQRRQKLNEEQNRLKIIKISTQKQSPPKNAFSKMNNSKNVVDKHKTSKKIAKLHRPNPRKSIVTSVQKNLIITFSENRRDTLRSAALSTGLATKSSPSPNDMNTFLENTAKSLDKRLELPHNQDSAFKQPLKQQSLLNMLKQRKRKTTSSVKNSNDKEAVQQSAAFHNLRPRTASIN